MELTRREFLKWSLLTGAAVGLAGCAIPPSQALVSPLEMPEYRLPGVARWFATTCQECEGGCGASVRVIGGRAKKIEGVPEHPVNHGKMCARGHSSLQALYNPDRLAASWQKSGDKLSPAQDPKSVVKALSDMLNSATSRPGSMLWITRPLSGTRGALMAYLAEKVGARLWVLDFPGSSSERTAMKSLAGKPELPYYDLENADYVVNFGSDFLVSGHSSVHDGWAYGEFRQGKNRHGAKRGTMVAFSPRANASVACSDAWVPCKPGSEGWAALGLGNLLAESGKKGWPAWASKTSLDAVRRATGVSEETFQRVAAKLAEAKKPLALAGKENGLYTHGVWSVWVIESLNRLLTGKHQTFDTSALIPLPKQTVSSKNFVSTRKALSSLRFGEFQSVWVFDVNPRYLLPGKLDFESLLSKVRNKVVFSPYMNETALLADWVVATQTWLEAWGDRRVDAPYASAYNLQQPVTQVPDWSGSLCDSDWLLAAAGETAALKAHVPWASLHDLLKSRFQDESTWENLLVRGGIWEEASLDWEPYRSKNGHPFEPPPAVKSAGKMPGGMSAWNHLPKANIAGAEEANFSGDKNGQILIPFYSSSLGDGSLANRPWMQELPDVMATTVWTTWIEIPTEMARKLGVTRGDVLKLTSASGSIESPAFPNPGLHPDAVAVPVGQGHYAYGQYADNHGTNVLSILDPNWQKDTGELAWLSTRVSVEKTGEKIHLTTMDSRMDRLTPEALTL